MKSIFSNQLSLALAEVATNFSHGKETAKHPLIKPESIAIMKKAFFEIKDIFTTFENKVDLSKENLDFSMGKYVVSGHVFPHIWGSLYPSESGSISACIPQMFLIRKSSYLKWGIGLSDSGNKNKEMMDLLAEFFNKEKLSLDALKSKGFGDSVEIEGDRHTKHLSFVRMINLELQNNEVIKDEIVHDFIELLPIYCRLIAACRSSGLIKTEALGNQLDQTEYEVTKENWKKEWDAWWNTKFSEDFESLSAPEYLKSEFPDGFASQKQKWEIGKRESLIAVEESLAGNVNPLRAKALISGSIKRTGFSGAWRGDVEKGIKPILKAIKEFEKTHPNGCTDQELEALLMSVKSICGYRVESFVTRILCDISPNRYMPISAFTYDALSEASDLMSSSNIAPEDSDYHNICSAAISLAKETGIFGLESADLYKFDHFLYWVNKFYIPEFKNNAKVKYWSVAAGEESKYWTEFQKNKIIAIGWPELGDLNKFSDLDSLKTAYANLYKPKNQPWNITRALYEFKNSMDVGDVVFVKGGRDLLLGVGIVRSNYIFDTSRGEYNNIRKVEWIKTGNWSTKEIGKFDVKTLTNITPYPDFVKKLADLANFSLENVIDATPIIEEIFDVNQALENVYVPEVEFKSMLGFLKHKKNIVLEGPPGVGKTYVAKQLAKCLTNGDTTAIEFVQFHQSYSYEDFVQGIRPDSNGGFSVSDGIFYRFCQAARDSKNNFVFIIDEINRGNLSKIFGELLMLIEDDKRDQPISLTYSKTGEKFSIPQNLYIIGTMNTADRGLSLVDYALRRRFAFFKLKPQFVNESFKRNLFNQGLTEADVIRLIKAMSLLNSEIEKDKKYLGEGFSIGHAYFKLKPADKTFENWFDEIIKFEIEPLLKEYWYDSHENLERVLIELKSA